MTAFQELTENRDRLQEFCRFHYPSLEYFNAGLSFAIHRDEIDEGKIDATKARHLTSSATCYSSLFECPIRFRPADSKDPTTWSQNYAAEAIKRDPKDWTSDGSAPIYCRCRTLPFVLRNIPKWDDRIGSHIDAVLVQMEQPGRFAIGEAGPGVDASEWYKPNAYHTYWAIELLAQAAQLFKTEYDKLDRDQKLTKRVSQMHLWARESLGYQVSLHSANSTLLDSDQLAWSLAIVIRSPETFQANPAEQDFIRHAFKCLFETQKKNGSWQHYAPLFHYEKTGNAYCYIFESFAALLRHALAPGAVFVRAVLKENCDRLMNLWKYAESTQILIDAPLKVLLWSSGHRTNNAQPESWATASVFAYSQNLRRLLGIWTREEALAYLPVRNPFTSPSAATKLLAERTRTWTSDNNLTDTITSLFVTPVVSNSPFDTLEPDNQPIDKNGARSAILFGPPGASKTTIVRALAGAVGWDYIELHASHFVADGLPNVQSKADEIFRRLMELDHAIVLFDEIDELVREREDEPDAFGRFLTTSMLPKLAELWKSRKVMYFVASNHISYFDRAIIRSERFDAVIFVSPPSFEAKKEELITLLLERHGKTVTFDVEKSLIDGAMPTFKLSDDPKKLAKKALPSANILAKFVLLRWDELAELAHHLNNRLAEGGVIDKKLLAEGLRKVRDGRWRTQREYFEYVQGPSYERRDFGKTRTWDVRPSSAR